MRDSPLDERFLALLRSPANGREFTYDGRGILSDGETLWPCVDGIPYLRLGREPLRRQVVDLLRRGDPAEALSLLLTDRKDDTVPSVSLTRARRVARGPNSASDAMAGLEYGGLSWYLLHRWSQPTYLSALALVQAHASESGRLLDLGCGTGHVLRAWQQARGPAAAVGADVVFSHLWIARRFAAKSAWLVCFDADGPFPFSDAAVGAALVQDAFHYFTRKRHVIRELRRVSQDVLLGHVHNAYQFNYSAGTPLSIEEYLVLVDPQTVYDDGELTRSTLTETEPEPLSESREMLRSPAVALATGPRRPRGVHVTLPPRGTPMALNPILTSGSPVWPSPKFEAEFVGDWTYLKAMTVPPPPVVRQAATEGLGASPEIDEWARLRSLLDIPERWL